MSLRPLTVLCFCSSHFRLQLAHVSESLFQKQGGGLWPRKVGTRLRHRAVSWASATQYSLGCCLLLALSDCVALSTVTIQATVRVLLVAVCVHELFAYFNCRLAVFINHEFPLYSKADFWPVMHSLCNHCAKQQCVWRAWQFSEFGIINSPFGYLCCPVCIGPCVSSRVVYIRPHAVKVCCSCEVSDPF
jgi:hypothetical protein